MHRGCPINIYWSGWWRWLLVKKAFSSVIKLPYLFMYAFIRFAKLNTKLTNLTKMRVYDRFLSTADILGWISLCWGAGEGFLHWEAQNDGIMQPPRPARPPPARCCSFPAAFLTTTTKMSPAITKCSLWGKMTPGWETPLRGKERHFFFLNEWLVVENDGIENS